MGSLWHAQHTRRARHKGLLQARQAQAQVQLPRPHQAQAAAPMPCWVARAGADLRLQEFGEIAGPSAPSLRLVHAGCAAAVAATVGAAKAAPVGAWMAGSGQLESR